MNKCAILVLIGLLATCVEVCPQNTYPWPQNGYIGVGTTNPSYPLEVVGGIQSTASGPVGPPLSLFNSSKTTPGTGAYWKVYNMTGSYGNSLQFDVYDTIGCNPGGLCANRLALLDSGNVGIGTTGPGQLLQVGAAYSQNPAILIGGNDSNNSSGGAFSLLFGAWRDVEPNMTSGIVATPVWTCCGGFPSGGYAGIRQNNLAFYRFYDPANPGNYAPQMFVSGATGNVGIGTTSPSKLLDVAGTIRTSASGGDTGGVVYPDGTQQATAWTGVLCGGDYAEAVDAGGDRKHYEPGDVLVLGDGNGGDVERSAEPYSTMVAGIFATKPGVVGRRQTLSKSDHEIPMAMIGIVPAKVSTENGPIRRGDLLVTSSTPGYAMKGTDRTRLTGAVIGKAMGSLDSGTGVIEVLVTLQ